MRRILGPAVTVAFIGAGTFALLADSAGHRPQTSVNRIRCGDAPADLKSRCEGIEVIAPDPADLASGEVMTEMFFHWPGLEVRPASFVASVNSDGSPTVLDAVYLHVHYPASAGVSRAEAKNLRYSCHSRDISDLAAAAAPAGVSPIDYAALRSISIARDCVFEDGQGTLELDAEQNVSPGTNQPDQAYVVLEVLARVSGKVLVSATRLPYALREVALPQLEKYLGQAPAAEFDPPAKALTPASTVRNTLIQDPRALPQPKDISQTEPLIILVALSGPATGGSEAVVTLTEPGSAAALPATWAMITPGGRHILSYSSYKHAETVATIDAKLSVRGETLTLAPNEERRSDWVQLLLGTAL